MKTVFAESDSELQALLDSLEAGDELVLPDGVFSQKLEINVPGITIRGQGDGTVISYGDYARKLDSSGVEYNTFRTYTVAVCADRVTLRDLVIENSALDPATRGQEVALTVCGDNFITERCVFRSTQDTLFCGPLPDDLIIRYDGFLNDKLRISRRCRQIYKSCTIAGSVDFIFGCGDCLFDGCTIISVDDGRDVGYVAAPSHARSDDVGFVFRRCRFISDGKVGDGSIFLARPWRDYGKSTFIDCEYGSHISTLGFDKWNDTERDKTARFAESVKPIGRVPWSRELTANDAERLLKHFE